MFTKGGPRMVTSELSWQFPAEIGMLCSWPWKPSHPPILIPAGHCLPLEQGHQSLSEPPSPPQ